MEIPQLKVISKKKVSPPDSGSYYEVMMSDGSEWVCDENGQHWKRTILTKPDLDEDDLLKKFLNKKKSL